MHLFCEKEIQKLIRPELKLLKMYSVIMIDLDYIIRFSLRITRGEMEKIIKKMHQFFQKQFPPESIILKSEGDEFFVFMPEWDRDHTIRLIEEVRKAFKKVKFASEGRDEYKNITFTFSAGVSGCPDDSLVFEEICRQATVCLFLAKAFRRNRVYGMPDKESLVIPPERILLMPDGKIRTILGKYGEVGHLYHPEKATEVLFWEPQSIDVDQHGNLYIVDQNNHIILKYDGEEVVRVAGNGKYGYTGDNGMAAFSTLNKPTGLAVCDNILFITDTGNDVVRKVDTESGIISTVAGVGAPGYAGDNGPANVSKLDKPGGAATDNKGNLYINDIANNVIRKIDKQNIITTFAGSGQYGYGGDGEDASNASFGEIYGIGIDKSRYRFLYLADYFNHCIRAVDLTARKISTVAGQGVSGYKGDGQHPLSALLNRPVAVCSDIHGNIFIAESGNHCIRVIPAGKSKIFTLVGDGTYGIGRTEDIKDYKLANPNGIAADDSFHLYILDGANNRISMIDYSDMNK